MRDGASVSHRHVDPNDPTESYGMPSKPCVRCGDACTDCSSTVEIDGVKTLVCDHCADWLAMTDEERRAEW